MEKTKEKFNPKFNNSKLENLHMIMLSDKIIDEIFHMQSGNSLEYGDMGFCIESGVDSNLKDLADLINWMIEKSYSYNDADIVEMHHHLTFVHSLKDHFKKFQVPTKERLELINQTAREAGTEIIERDLYEML